MDCAIEGPKGSHEQGHGPLTNIFTAHYNPPGPSPLESQVILPDWKLQPCREVKGHSQKLMPKELPSQLPMVGSPGLRGYQSQASYGQRRVPLPGISHHRG